MTAINEPMAADLRRLYPRLAAATSVIPNGYDPNEAVDDVDLGPGFWIVHTGRIYAAHRAGRRLSRGPRRAARRCPRPTSWAPAGPEIAARAAALGVAGRVRFEPFAPRSRALGLQRAAGALLLDHRRRARVAVEQAARVPGERAAGLRHDLHALGCERPGRPRRAPDAASRPANRCGPPSPPSSPTREAGRLPGADPEVVRRFDGRALTSQLAGLLDDLVAGRG